MGKYEGYLIATDFDGTFAGPGAVISRENLLAVRHFQENGGLFTIASGRVPSFLAGYQQEIQANAPLICTNGSVICRPDSLQLLHCMSFGEEFGELADFLYGNPLVDELLISGPDVNWPRLHPRRVPRAEARYEALPGPFCRVLCQQTPEETLALKSELIERFGARFVYGRSWSEGLEITAGGSGKGACLRWIREYLGSDRVHTTIGVGDYENDLTLIRDADIGYAVGNAIDECKQVADRVTVPYTRHALAAIIEEIG